MKLTEAQFETLKRRENPEVYTTEQMNQWIEGLKDTLVKAEVGELDEVEKAEVDLFNEEFKSFTKVTVISSPKSEELIKGLRYTDFYIREQQVEWTEVDNIIKSEDGGEDTIEKGREGIYKPTATNTKLGRVGAKFGQHNASAVTIATHKAKQEGSKEGGELKIPANVHDIIEDYIEGNEDADLDGAIDSLHALAKKHGKTFNEKQFNRFVKNEMEDGGQGRLNYSTEVVHKFFK